MPHSRLLYNELTFFSGPPGVGKTLTAEGLAEYLRRLLYSVCFLAYSLDYSNALDLRWGAGQRSLTPRRPIVLDILPCPSLEGIYSSR